MLHMRFFPDFGALTLNLNSFLFLYNFSTIYLYCKFGNLETILSKTLKQEYNYDLTNYWVQLISCECVVKFITRGKVLDLLNYVLYMYFTNLKVK